MTRVDQRTYNTLTAAIFLIVAVAHLLRSVAAWPVAIGGLDIPIWISWLVVVVAGALAWFGLRQNRRAAHPPTR